MEKNRIDISKGNHFATKALWSEVNSLDKSEIGQNSVYLFWAKTFR